MQIRQDFGPSGLLLPARRRASPPGIHRHMSPPAPAASSTIPIHQTRKASPSAPFTLYTSLGKRASTPSQAMRQQLPSTSPNTNVRGPVVPNLKQPISVRYASPSSSSVAAHAHHQPALTSGTPRTSGVTMPMSARSHLSTSSSLQVSSIAGLEDAIAEVLGNRMQNLTDIRGRIEQLSALYRDEEAAFQLQMSMVLEQSEVVRVANETREQALESALKKERGDRQRILNLMKAFKEEGSMAIKVLKESLAEAQQKLKGESEKNLKLAAQLRKWQSGGGGGGGSRSSSIQVVLMPSDDYAPAGESHHHPSSSSHFHSVNGSHNTSGVIDDRPPVTTDLTVGPSSADQQRWKELTSIVEEQDAIIEALGRKNKALEQQLHDAQNCRGSGESPQRSSPSQATSSQQTLPTADDSDAALLYAEAQKTANQQLRHIDNALNGVMLVLRTYNQQRDDDGNTDSGGVSSERIHLRKAVVLYKAKCDMLERLAKLLSQWLASEQRLRLRSEEQGTRIATAQDKLLQKLEDRIRDLEGSGSTANTLNTYNNANAALSGRHAQQRPSSAGVTPHLDTDLLMSVTPSGSRQQLVDDEPTFIKRPADDVFHEGSAEVRESATLVMQTDIPHIPSLEEQLARVSKEFNASVSLWNAALMQTSHSDPPQDASVDGISGADL